MEYRFLGKTGVRVSELCFGTMSFGSTADEAQSASMFHACRDAGINLYDCADVYAGGRSEEILGRLIADCRDQVVITSKAYFPFGEKGPNDVGSSRYHLLSAVEGSLRRLKTDRIDLFFLHRFDSRTDLLESWRALDHLVQQGKILYPAISNFAAWQTMKVLGLAALHDLAPAVCLQPMYNLVKRQAEVELLPMALSEGLAVLPYSPLGGGLLTGKYGAGKRPELGRLVDNSMYGVRYGASINYDVADGFAALAADWGHNPVSLAIAWVARHPAVTAPLIGARNLEQLGACLAAAEISLTDEQYAQISDLSPAPAPATDRNEEQSAHNYGTR